MDVSQPTKKTSEHSLKPESTLMNILKRQPPTVLVMSYDSRREGFAQYCIPTAIRFCQQNDVELILRVANRYPEPYSMRISHVLEQLHAGRRVVYSDVDVLFRDRAKVRDLFSGGEKINVSTDSNGLCDGVFAMLPEPSVIKFCEVWRDCGLPIHGERFEQDTMKLLVSNFAWIKSMVHGIPETVVSNPESRQAGSVCHHFWSGAERALEKVAVFDWKNL